MKQPILQCWINVSTAQGDNDFPTISVLPLEGHYTKVDTTIFLGNERLKAGEVRERLRVAVTKRNPSDHRLWTRVQVAEESRL